MATGDRKVNIYNKKVMAENDWKLYFLNYLNTKIDANADAVFPSEGTLSGQTVDVIAGSGNDQFTLDLSNASEGIDELGNIMDIANLQVGEYSDIAFENDTGITYSFGVRYQSIPDGIERNARTSEPEYKYFRDTIGEQGNPDSVVDNTTSIRLTVTGMVDSGIDHGNRSVMVWLVNPVNPEESIAFYTTQTGYGTPDTYIDIPYTALQGPLGQTAPTYPISLTAIDYKVYFYGPSWSIVDLDPLDEYWFLGSVVGNGPAAIPAGFDMSEQNPAFLISLDSAYRANSIATPAPGRTITVDKGAVRFVQSATTPRGEDDFNTTFVIDKTAETTTSSIGYRQEFRPGFFIPEISSVKFFGGPATDLEETEAITTGAATDVITFTRGAVDLTTYADQLVDGAHYIVISGTAADDGHYFINSILGVNTLDVVDVDFGAVAFTGGTGTVEFFMSVDFTSHTEPLESAYSDSYTRNLVVFKGSDGESLRMAGAPVDSEIQSFHTQTVSHGGTQSKLVDFKVGRQIIKGGGSTYINRKRTDEEVVGWAHYQSDKRSVNLHADFLPNEASSEWGFDYRGNFWLAGTFSDWNQLAATFRYPIDYNFGGKSILSNESFTYVNATTLQLDTTLRDTSLLFGGSGDGGVIAEIQFDAPNVADSGIYLVIDNNGADQVSFINLNGTPVVFTAASTGDVRFYGGDLFATYRSPLTIGTIVTKNWMHHTYNPTEGSELGGHHYAAIVEDAVGSVIGKYHQYFHSQTGAAMMALRDGGHFFGRAISTRSATTVGHGLTQWDMITSALIQGDVMKSPQFQATGTLPTAFQMSVAKPLTKRFTGETAVQDTRALHNNWVQKVNEAVGGDATVLWGGWYYNNSQADSYLLIPIPVVHNTYVTDVQLTWSQRSGTADFDAEIVTMNNAGALGGLMVGPKQCTVGTSMQLDESIMASGDEFTVNLATYRYFLRLASAGSSLECYFLTGKILYNAQDIGMHASVGSA